MRIDGSLIEKYRTDHSPNGIKIMTHGSYNEFKVASGSKVTTPELPFSVSEREEITSFELIISVLRSIIILVLEILKWSGVLDVHPVSFLLSFDMVKQSIIILISLSITLQREVISQ
jgi:hypothetical protein